MGEQKVTIKVLEGRIKVLEEEISNLKDTISSSTDQELPKPKIRLGDLTPSLQGIIKELAGNFGLKIG